MTGPDKIMIILWVISSLTIIVIGIMAIIHAKDKNTITDGWMAILVGFTPGSLLIGMLALMVGFIFLITEGPTAIISYFKKVKE